MRIVTAHFASGDDFLAALRHGASDGEPTLQLRTRAELAGSEAVVVELAVPGLPNRVRVVASALPPGDAAAAPPDGEVWLQVARDDRAALEFVVAHARRIGGPAIMRHHERFPVSLPCDWSLVGGSARVLSTTEDLSAGGAFVRAFSPPEVGTELVVELPDTKHGSLVLHGRVAWVREGEPGSAGGMGVRFARPDEDDVRRLREMLRRVAERGRVTLTP